MDTMGTQQDRAGALHRFCRLGAIAAALAATAAGMPARSQAPASAGERVPVIVELFTSEGCSSCPPADDVLTKLVATQPVANAEIIALGEHVDYWDRLGWRDPFSSAAFTARQSEYASKAFGTDNIYTPQLVVDGREALVGSDYRAATAAIARAAAPGSTAAAARLRISVNAEHNPSRASVHVITRIDPRGASMPKAAADVFLAVVEDGLVTQVKRGENQGRELHHTAVVRSLTPMGAISADSVPWSADTTIRFPPDWNAARSRVVAFVQERAKRKMLSAAAANLPNKVS
jgi:hypothetical protein